jgi:hypothetical protein
VIPFRKRDIAVDSPGTDRTNGGNGIGGKTGTILICLQHNVSGPGGGGGAGGVIDVPAGRTGKGGTS